MVNVKFLVVSDIKNVPFKKLISLFVNRISQWSEVIVIAHNVQKPVTHVEPQARLNFKNLEIIQS